MSSGVTTSSSSELTSGTRQVLRRSLAEIVVFSRCLPASLASLFFLCIASSKYWMSRSGNDGHWSAVPHPAMSVCSSFSEISTWGQTVEKVIAKYSGAAPFTYTQK